MTAKGDPNYLWEFQGEDFVFARLDEEQDAAEAMSAGPERDAALTRVESLRLVAAEHCIYVSREGENVGHCISCPPSYGIPCATIFRVARIWRFRPDYKPGWNRSIDDPRWRPPGTESRLEVARLGGYKNLYWARQEAS
jgi:hypothetical protein